MVLFFETHFILKYHIISPWILLQYRLFWLNKAPTEVSTSYLFQAERYLVMKLMAQKEILLNRQDYLSDEISSASKNVSAIQSKIDFINELKLQKLGELKAKQRDFEEQELQTMKKR